MQKYLFQSKNKEVSMNEVLKELNVSENEILTHSHDEKNGLFGKKYFLDVVKISDVADYGRDLLNELLNAMGKIVKIEKKVRDKSIKYEIISKDNSILIGKNGKILDSIQMYIKQVIYNDTGFYINIQLDVEGYKEKQNYFLVKKAKQLALEVKKTKQTVKLDPMNSYERKIIHDALQNFKNIKSDSEGVEPNRYVVISYCESGE